MLNFWRKTFFFVLTGFLSWTFFAFAQEQGPHKTAGGNLPINFYEKPPVYIIDLKINSQTKEKIEGSFAVHNDEIYEIYNLNYRVMLLKGDDLNNLELVDLQYEDDPQSFYALRKSDTTHPFSYKIPQNINPGEYRLRLQIGSANSKNNSLSMNEFSWRDIKIILNGKGKFLDTKNFKFLGGENGSYNPNAEIKIGFDVLNPSPNPITAFPQMIIDRYVTKKVRVSKAFGDSLTFEPGKKKYVELVLPKIDQPQIYQLFLQFVSAQSEEGEIYSSVVKKNFTISGPFVEILFIYHDKESYKKGDTAIVKVTFLSSSVPKEQKENKADLLLSVLNQDTGKNCSAVSKSNLPFKGGLGQIIVQVPITSNCLKPIISQDLLIAGKSVDSNILYTPSMTGLAAKIAAEINQRIKRNLQIVAGILAGLGIIIFATFYFKRKKRAKFPESV